MKTNCFTTFLVTLILFFCIFKIEGQYTLDWTQNYGGSDIEQAESIITTTDGGFIITGHSKSNDVDLSENYGDRDFWVVKLDSARNIEWENNYGGSDEDIAFSILQTDGGYIIAGQTKSNDGDVFGNFGSVDIWVLKIDLLGNILWENNYGTNRSETFKSIEKTSDGDFIISAISTLNTFNRKCWVFKINSFGIILWQKEFGIDESINIPHSIIQTNEGGYVLLASSNAFHDNPNNDNISDLWVLKLDRSGDLEWDVSYGGSDNELAGAIVQTEEGEYVVLSTTHSQDGDVSNQYGQGDLWILKLNVSGNLIWEKNYGGSYGDYAYDMILTSDGDLLISAGSASNDIDLTGNNGGFDIWMVKLDIDGGILWQNNFGGSQMDNGVSIIETDDNGFVVVGGSTSEDGDVPGNYGNLDVLVLKFSSSSVGLSFDSGPDIFNVYPNPSDGIFIVDHVNVIEDFKIKVFDINGKLVYSTSNLIGKLYLDFLPSGQYLIALKSDESLQQRKILIQK